MTNKKELLERLETITADSVFNFLDEKKVTKSCPMCSSTGEQIISETTKASLAELVESKKRTQTFVTFFRHTPAKSTDTDANYYYKLSCDHCGFITTHEIRQLLRWLDENNRSMTGGGDE